MGLPVAEGSAGCRAEGSRSQVPVAGTLQASALSLLTALLTLPQPWYTGLRAAFPFVCLFGFFFPFL